MNHREGSGGGEAAATECNSGDGMLPTAACLRRRQRPRPRVALSASPGTMAFLFPTRVRIDESSA